MLDYFTTCPHGLYECELAWIAQYRADLAKYVDSTRYALTWDDVLYRERNGRPYPKA